MLKAHAKDSWISLKRLDGFSKGNIKNLTLLLHLVLKIFDTAVFAEHQLFQDGGPSHVETSPLICRANQ